MPTSRTYQSPLREAQAALTRERILMAAKTYLEHNDIETLSLRQLAELAGVSPPTVYAHFATVDDLVAAFFQWLRPRLGLQKALPPLDDFAELPKALFPNYQAYGALLRNLMNKPSWDRQRGADAGQRHGRWIAAVGEALPDLTPEQRRRGAMVRLRLLVADGVALADGHLRLHPEGGRAGRVLGGRRAGRRSETRSIGPRRRAPGQASVEGRRQGAQAVIHHFSFPARDPARVARVLAELIGGRAYRFPGPLPGAAMAVSGDRHGTMIEIYPESVVMAPGDGEAPVAYRNAPGERSHAGFHALLSVPHDRATIERIGQAAGWRTKFFSRAAPGLPPVFHVVEVWVENRLLLEVVPADMIEVYETYMQIGRMDALDLSLNPQPSHADKI